MAGKFDNQVAVVTGGASGIGRSAALALAAEGAHVIIADLDDDGAADVVEHLRSPAGRGAFVRTDVADGQQVKRLIDGVVAEYGRLDLAFNNAGILGSPMARTVECSEDNWRRVLDVNLTGLWLCLKHELRKMRKAQRGAIVNAASAAAGTGSFVSLPYTVSKQGILALTRYAATEYAGRGIRVNAVCPGYIRTPMLENLMVAAPHLAEQLAADEPMQRLGTPEEAAAAVLWLLSDAASFVTGHALNVDGGLLAS